MAKKKKTAKKEKAVKKKTAEKKKTPRRKKVKGPWSADETGLLKRLFPNNRTAELAAQLGRPTDAVKKKAARMGLRKSKKHMKSLGRK